MGGHWWTTEEIDLLKRLYPGASWEGLLNAFPGRTLCAIRVQAVTLQIKRTKNGKTYWNGYEKKILREIYLRAPWSAICEQIPRHPRGSIAKMANVMGLKRDAYRQSPYPIIRELRTIRQDRKLEQSKLARKLGSHQVQIAKWERGEHVPRLRTFFDWVEALGLRLKIETN